MFYVNVHANYSAHQIASRASFAREYTTISIQSTFLAKLVCLTNFTCTS